MALHRLDCLSSHHNLDAYQFVTDFLEKTPPEVVRPARLVSGEDILELGYKAGPVIGAILRSVEEAQLNGEISTKVEAISFVEKKFQANGRTLKKSSQ